ncbi:MAG: helix-turn-helix domain-containing protein [Chloroflexi bacterium]|nr:helix-turn-helix domain-containing protein [Chloroflexota bacterium]
MLVNRETDLLTIAEAAKLLKVSVVTIQRWVKQGRLPAYQLGPRQIRIRCQDLASVLVREHQLEVNTATEAEFIRTTIRPLTEGEVEQRFEAIRRSEALIRRMRARRGDEPLEPSWKLIREARELRSKRHE